MKKYLFLAILMALICGPIASAQKIESRSRSITVYEEPKAPKVKKDHLPHNWYAKVGGGILIDHYENESAFDYNIAFGYQKIFNLSGWYWGAQIGGASFPHKIYSDIDTDFGLYIGPTLGLKRNIGKNLELDTHLGVSYAFVTGFEQSAPFWEISAGIWYKRFLIELMYQGSYQDEGYGFAPTTRLLLNLGFKF